MLAFHISDYITKYSKYLNNILQHKKKKKKQN